MCHHQTEDEAVVSIKKLAKQRREEGETFGPK